MALEAQAQLAATPAPPCPEFSTETIPWELRSAADPYIQTYKNRGSKSLWDLTYVESLLPHGPVRLPRLVPVAVAQGECLPEEGLAHS